MWRGADAHCRASLQELDWPWSIERKISAPRRMSWWYNTSLSRREPDDNHIPNNERECPQKVSTNARTEGGSTLLNRGASSIMVTVCSSLITGHGLRACSRTSNKWPNGLQELPAAFRQNTMTDGKDDDDPDGHSRFVPRMGSTPLWLKR